MPTAILQEMKCRVCGDPVNVDPVVGDAVFLDASNNVTAMPAHEECYEREILRIVRDGNRVRVLSRRSALSLSSAQRDGLEADREFHGVSYEG